MFYKVFTTIAVIAAILILAVQTLDSWGESDGIAIPLTKRSDTDARELHLTSHSGNSTRGPSGVDGSEGSTGTPHPSAVQRDAMSAALGLTKFANGIWYGTIWVGTPPQRFNVQLNTGFSDLVIPASNGDENCRSHPDLWNPTANHITNVDLNVNFWIAFTDGKAARGRQYIDTVGIAGLTANRQTIGAATTYSPSLGAPRFIPDGILGLGLPGLSELDGESPLLHTLFNEGKLARPMFSLKLTSTGGELYLGGTNTALYIENTLIFNPIINPAVWQLRIDKIQVNGRTLLTNKLAIVDTAANYICGDPQGVLALHHEVGGGPFQGVAGYYTFPCNSIPSVTFIIGEMSIQMEPDFLNKGRVTPDSSNCFSGIAVANEEHSGWSFGTIFLQQVYTVFDFNSQAPRIGFARLAV